MKLRPAALVPPVLLAACNAEPRAVPAAPRQAAATLPEAAASISAIPLGTASLPAPHLASDDPAPPPRPLAAALVRAEWAKADNRRTCGPLAFTGAGGAPATARRADFSGGWAVAFDLPRVRSAYGLAGAGESDADAAPPGAQEPRLRAQWPHFVRLPKLPAPAFAGYGIEGAHRYTATNPDGRGLKSLAYLRVGGQRCTYNVWSRLGRAHLETLLDSLRML